MSTISLALTSHRQRLRRVMSEAANWEVRDR